VKRLLRLLLFHCAPVMAQITVTYAPTGAQLLIAETGKQIHSVQIVDGWVVVPPGTAVPPTIVGLIYQEAVRNGLAPMGPAEARLLFTRTAQRDPINIAAESISIAFLGGAVLGTSNVVSMTPQMKAGLLVGHAVADAAIPLLRQKAPDPTTVLTDLLEPGHTVVAAGASTHFTLIARYQAGQRYLLGPFEIK